MLPLVFPLLFALSFVEQKRSVLLPVGLTNKYSKRPMANAEGIHPLSHTGQMVHVKSTINQKLNVISMAD